MIKVLILINKFYYEYFLGRKTDAWHAIDPITGIKQHRLTMDGVESMCPPIDKKNLFFYIGRTGK